MSSILALAVLYLICEFFRVVAGIFMRFGERPAVHYDPPTVGWSGPREMRKELFQ